MTGRRVLVTRPQPGAAKTARRLREMGFSPVTLPLSQTRALPVAPADIPAAVNAVAVTSVNAIIHAPADIVARLVRLRCFAVGEKTAAAASKAGFSDIVAGPGDAAGLARLILESEGTGTSVAYLAGRVRMSAFEAELAEAGARVLPIETYDTLPVDYPDPELAGLFGQCPIDAVLLYSLRAAEAALGLCSDPRWSASFAQARYLCLSSRIAAAFSGADSFHVAIAPQPSEDSLLSLLTPAL